MHDSKVQRGVAMHNCRSMQGDEKKHCQEQAARIAHSIYEEEKPDSASN